MIDVTRRRRRRPQHARQRALGVLTMAVTLFAAAGTVETAQAATAAARPFGGFTAGKVVPLTHGHSHNDYARRQPLSEALSRGYTSIEADVVLVRGQLLVGHDPLQARARGNTLRALYLDPLADWVKRNGGTVFGAGGPSLTLLVDVKSEARTSWRALEGVLAGYEEMLTRFTADGARPGAVTVIVSGNRAGDLVAADTDRFTALDGRVADLADINPAPADLIPLVSERWGALFRWTGNGTMPATELKRLRTLVDAAHAQGRRIRFWDTPGRTVATRENVWRTELAAGVDLLNIDDLAAGQQFLLAEQQRKSATAPGASGAGHRLAGAGVRRTS